MNNIRTVITPATAMYLMGLLYRNTRTSCVSLAFLCAQISHDTLRRVLYQKVPWSRRLWETFVQSLVLKGGYLVIDDTSWGTLYSCSGRGELGVVEQCGQAGVGHAGGLTLVDPGEVEGAAGDSAVAEGRTVESQVSNWVA